MVSDSVVPSPSGKDFGKKKRANRSAKLKQCKLDARREQWLSQGAAVTNRGSKEVLPNENNRRKVLIDNVETRPKDGGCAGEEKENESSVYHDFDDGHSSSDGTTNFAGSSSLTSSSISCSNSTSSTGCCSGNISEEEGEGEGEGDDNCVDDWEAVADALAANDDNTQSSHVDNSCLETSESISSQLVEACVNSAPSHEDLKQDEKTTAPPRVDCANSRAWSPDDAYRPQSLPNLSKQLSFPNADRTYGHGGGRLPWCCSNIVNLPTSCPICCEDLDGTDASFLPCICGFRLCLFCYNRIRQVDGRCPGCRKKYEDNPMESEISNNAGCMMFRLSRSYSMVARS